MGNFYNLKNSKPILFETKCNGSILKQNANSYHTLNLIEQKQPFPFSVFPCQSLSFSPLDKASIFTLSNCILILKRVPETDNKKFYRKIN